MHNKSQAIVHFQSVCDEFKKLEFATDADVEAPNCGRSFELDQVRARFIVRNEAVNRKAVVVLNAEELRYIVAFPMPKLVAKYVYSQLDERYQSNEGSGMATIPYPVALCVLEEVENVDV